MTQIPKIRRYCVPCSIAALGVNWPTGFEAVFASVPRGCAVRLARDLRV
jgi:hypothetical protein